MTRARVYKYDNQTAVAVEEFQPWRNLVAAVILQAQVDFVTDTSSIDDEVNWPTLPAGEFMASDWWAFMVDALGLDLELVRDEWRRRREEYRALRERGCQREYKKWVNTYFPGWSRFYSSWLSMAEVTLR